MSGEAAPRAPRPPWSEFKAALGAVRFRPSRRLGQNFLLDENAARAIARDAALVEGDFVFEVGPGCGFLSVHLAHQGVRLLAVEIDERLAAVAEQFLEPYAQARVVRADVLAGKRQWSAEVARALPEHGDWHLVSNLPYSVSAPVLGLCAAGANPPLSATVLVQDEVAQRLVSSPGERSWGPLTVTVQLAYRVCRLRTLAPALFWPRPRVDSALLRLERHETLAHADSRAATAGLAARLMRHRRKTLSRVLRDLLGDQERALGILRDQDIDGRLRAERLDLQQLEQLAVRLPPDCWQP